MQMRPKLIPALTSIRFFAAVWVVCFHLLQPVVADQPFWIRNIVGSGYIGVSLFFILSGFILAYTYILPGNTTSPRQFWIARFARIYPVYFVAFLAWLPFFLWTFLKQASLQALLSSVTSLFLLQAWWPTLCSFNPPSWSLSAEAFFYLLFPFLGVWFARKSRQNPLYLAALMCLLTFVAPALYMHFRPDGNTVPGPNFYGTWLGIVKVNPLCRLPEFLLGVAVAMQFSAKGRPRHTGLGAAGAIVCILLIAAFSEHFPYPLLHNALLAPAFGILILCLAFDNPIARALSFRPLVLLGEASYSLYILHVVVIAWTGALLRRSLPQWNGTTSVVAVQFMLAILVSVVSFKLVEIPSRRYLLQRFGSRNSLQLRKASDAKQVVSIQHTLAEVSAIPETSNESQ